MAPKKSQKRPTEAQLLKSRLRIGGYLTQLGEPWRKAAKNLGTTEANLRKYLFQDPSTTIDHFTRNRGFRRMYIASTNVVEKRRKELVGYLTLEGKRVPDYRETGPLYKARVFQGPIRGVEPYETDAGTDEQDRLYQRIKSSIKLGAPLPSLEMSLSWQNYTSRYDIPTSMEEIKELYAKGELSKRQAASILTHWHNIYSNMSDDWYEDMLDQFAEYDELNDLD